MLLTFSIKAKAVIVYNMGKCLSFSSIDPNF